MEFEPPLTLSRTPVAGLTAAVPAMGPEALRMISLIPSRSTVILMRPGTFLNWSAAPVSALATLSRAEGSMQAPSGTVCSEGSVTLRTPFS